METIVTRHPFILYFFFFRYFLQPRENGGKSVKVEELGSLRLNIVYTEDHVFPSEHYTPLRDLLLHSANVEVQYFYMNLTDFHNMQHLVLLLYTSLFDLCMLTPCPHCSACVSVHCSYSGGGVSREARSRHSPCASLSSLRQDRAFHQRHCSRWSQPHTVSTSLPLFSLRNTRDHSLTTSSFLNLFIQLCVQVQLLLINLEVFYLRRERYMFQISDAYLGITLLLFWQTATLKRTSS